MRTTRASPVVVRVEQHEHGRRPPGRPRRRGIAGGRRLRPADEDGHQHVGRRRQRIGQARQPAGGGVEPHRAGRSPPARRLVDELAVVALATRRREVERRGGATGRARVHRPPTGSSSARGAARRAGRHRPTTVAPSLENTSVPDARSASAVTRSPGRNSPATSARASGFSTSRWIVRLSGRAPNAGSVPSRTMSALAAAVSSSDEVLLRPAGARGPRAAGRRWRRGRPRSGRGTR